MAIAIVGTPTTYNSGSGGAVSSITINVPAGVVDGNYLTLAISSQNVTPSSTPAGWTLLQSSTTTALASILCGRIASSEPASYSPTVTTARTAAIMCAWSGVDATTQMDVASSSTNGTTAYSFAAITPVTAGAMVVAFGSQDTGSGLPVGTPASTNLTLDVNSATSAAAAANVLVVQGHFAWTSGAFTANLTSSQAVTRTTSVPIALRPAASTAIPPILVMPPRRH